MSWFTKKSAPAKDEVTKAIGKLDEARKSRRAALKELLVKLGDIPVDEKLGVVGEELVRAPKGGR